MNYYGNGNNYGYNSNYQIRLDNFRKPYGKPLTAPMQNYFPLNLFSVDEGFAKGTIFRDLYKPYKNYQPRKLMPATEKAKLLYDVDKYYFALHEIRMFLDDYPNNQEAINVFTQYQKAYTNAKNAYEAKYGALDIEAPNLNKSPWNWTMETWPWDEGM